MDEHLQPDLSLIIPCYNPAVNWKESLLPYINYAQTQIKALEVIIVNDGSTTMHADEAIAFFAPYPFIHFYTHSTNMGKGYALRRGVEKAKGRLTVFTDDDFPYTPESFTKILHALNQGADVAMGIRGSSYYKQLPNSRSLLSRLLRFFIRNLLHIPTDDTQCGLKGFNQKGKAVFLQTTIERYLFDLEFIFLAARNKLNIKTVEVELRDGIQLSTMHIGVLLQEAGNFISVLWRSLF